MPPGSIHVTPSVARLSSGPSYSVVRLAQNLRQIGCAAEVAALDWPGGPIPPDGVRLFKLGIGPRRLGASSAMRNWLRLAVEVDPKVVIHNHGMWQLNSVYPGTIARESGATLVHSPRGTFAKWAMSNGSRLKRLFWPLLQRPACQAASCFHATAASEASEIRDLGFEQPIAVIPNGIDVPDEDQTSRHRSKTVLFLSRLHPKKGLDLLLHAWAQVQHRHPTWDLCIAGSDESYYGITGYKAELQDLAQRLSLRRTSFVGDVHGSDKDQLFASASLFVLPTRNENFGVAVAEALSWAVPCIVTKEAPWRGLREKGAGWWIDCDADALACALDDAMSMEEDARWQMGIQGREWAAAEFAWPSVARRMSRTYEWLKGQGNQPEWIV
jgi:glycosyltransferase involved in cell wall biosynthesis